MVSSSPHILLHRHTLRQIPGLIHIQSLCHADVVSQQLQGQHLQAGHEMLIRLRHIDSEIHLIFNFVVAVSSQTHKVCLPVHINCSESDTFLVNYITFSNIVSKYFLTLFLSPLVFSYLQLSSAKALRVALRT